MSESIGPQMPPPEHADSRQDSELSDDDSMSDVDTDSADVNVPIEPSSKELKQQAQQLRKQLEHSPNDYDLHQRLIGVLRSLQHFDALQSAREQMHRTFPMHAELWTSWVEDQCSLITDVNDSMNVLSLIKTAQQDYMQPALWLKGMQFLVDRFADFEDGASFLSTFRDFAEHAAASIGHHLTKSAEFWLMFVAIEKNLPFDSELEQSNRIRMLYRRACTALSLAHSVLVDEYTQWEVAQNTSIEEAYQQAMVKAQGQIELRVPFENALAAALENGGINAAAPGQASAELQAAYQSYIEFELEQSAQKHPQRVQQLFERCISHCFLTHSFFESYSKFVTTHLRKARLAVAERAVRNHPWSYSFWVQRVLAAEDSKCTPLESTTSATIVEQCVALYQRAQASCAMAFDQQSELLLMVLDVCRRTLEAANADEDEPAGKKKKFHQTEEINCDLDNDAVTLRVLCRNAVGFVDQSAAQFAQLKENGDFASWQQFCALMHQIISYCAQLELQFCSLGQYCPNTGPDDDQEEAELKAAHLKAREFMTTILKVQGKEAASYLECLKFEFTFNRPDIKHCRSMLKRGVSALATQKASVQSTAELQMLCQAWIEFERRRGDIVNLNEANERCEKYLSQRASTTAAEFVAKALQPVAAEANTEAPIAKSDSRAGKADKRRRADTVVESSSKKRKNNAEQAVPVESQSDAQQAPEQQGAVDTNDVKVAAEPVAPISTEEVGSLLRDERTVFVLNLPFSATEEMLQELFGVHGTIDKIRLKRREDGRAVGFAHIQFATMDGAKAAVEKLHNSMLNGRTLQVSHSRPPPLGATDSEFTMFIRNVPGTWAPDHAQTLLREHYGGTNGGVLDIRLPRYPNGALRGIAYVQFNDETTLNNALHDHRPCDGIVLVGKRSRQSDAHVSKSEKLVADKASDNSSAPIRRVAPVAFVPRSQVRSANTTAKVRMEVPVKSAATPEVESSAPTANAASTGMSNNDFRKKLLGI